MLRLLRAHTACESGTVRCSLAHPSQPCVFTAAGAGSAMHSALILWHAALQHGRNGDSSEPTPRKPSPVKPSVSEISAMRRKARRRARESLLRAQAQAHHKVRARRVAENFAGSVSGTDMWGEAAQPEPAIRCVGCHKRDTFALSARAHVYLACWRRPQREVPPRGHKRWQVCKRRQPRVVLSAARDLSRARSSPRSAQASGCVRAPTGPLLSARQVSMTTAAHSRDGAPSASRQAQASTRRPAACCYYAPAAWKSCAQPRAIYSTGCTA